MSRTVWTRERFMGRVEVRPDGCWSWRGSHISTGYATVAVWRDGRWVGTTAHRFAYELFVGPIAADLDADHLCHNRGCVNPHHIEAVTHRENIHRMPGLFGRRARATKCDRGHAFEEFGVVDGDGRRRCAECRRVAARLRRTAA